MRYLNDYRAEFRSDKGRKRRPYKKRLWGGSNVDTERNNYDADREEFEEFKRRKREEEDLQKKERRGKGIKSIISTTNRTSEELRGWTNTLMRLKRMIGGY